MLLKVFCVCLILSLTRTVEKFKKEKKKQSQNCSFRFASAFCFDVTSVQFLLFFKCHLAGHHTAETVERNTVFILLNALGVYLKKHFQKEAFVREGRLITLIQKSICTNFKHILFKLEMRQNRSRF